MILAFTKESYECIYVFCTRITLHPQECVYLPKHLVEAKNINSTL
jgi:hypothetical protein